MSNTINYLVTYDSDITNPTYLTGITQLEHHRNIAPSEDTATITLAGIQRIQSAREVYFYRVNSDGSKTLKFRGMTTNPTYHVGPDGVTTTVEVNSLWYILQMRLFQIAGKSPPPLQPNTNPYLVYLNPTLGLNFGQLWADIVSLAFQESYSTGHLPTFHLANLQDNGMVNQTITYVTDFDYVVVNDNMNFQYQSVSATVDRLVTSALFNATQGSPFLAEYRMDIGDYPYTAPPDTVTPKLPTVTVMLFDPTHSKLGNGNNRTGIVLGDNSLDPAGTLPANLQYPMSYVEFGVTNGYEPIDYIVFSEGDNIVTIDLTYDYLSMNNSYVLSGGSFQGSDVVALPIDNQRSIAEFGLKQTNQPLQNVVDQGEIHRFVGTSINFFQHPIPNIVIHPDYVYASTHTLYPGDYVLVNAPSLAGVIEDSNGNLLEGSYPSGSTTSMTLAFTARIKTIDITWNPTDGEDITLTLTFPVTNVPITAWNPTNNTQQLGSPAGAMQFMYTTVTPAAKTMVGRQRQNEGAATHQSGGDFITNRNNPLQERVTDGLDSDVPANVVPDSFSFDIPMFVTTIPNSMNAIVNSPAPPAPPTTVESVKGDDILLYQFGVEVDSPSAQGSTTTAPSLAYLTVLQPDGMAIYDSVIDLNQMANILALLTKSHPTPPPPPVTVPPTPPSSAPLMEDIKGNVNLSGKYQIILRNPNAFTTMPNPIFATLPFPTLSVASFAGVGPSVYAVIVVACYDGAGLDPFAMTFPGVIYDLNQIVTINVTWNLVPGAGSYNVYIVDWLTSGAYDMLAYAIVDTEGASPTFPVVVGVSGLPTYEPFPPFAQLTGVAATNSGSATLVNNTTYWYTVTAVDAAGNESPCSAAGSWWKDGTQDTEPGTGAGTPTTNVNADSAIGTSILFVASTVNFTTGALVEIGNSTPRDEFALISGINPGVSLTLLSPLQYTHLALDADPVTVVPQSIFVTWSSVPFAVSYNIYRGSVFGSLTQIATGIIDTFFTDDGIYATSAIVAPIKASLVPSNIPYVIYANYSFQPDPSQTKNITGQGNNPSTAIVYDPTQQRVYQTQPYVAP